MIHKGIPKISDFGAGKEIGVTTSHKNGIMGAICYLDPQRHKSKNYKLQKSSDIYSLGVVFWQIFSGRKPFGNEPRNLDLFQKIINGQREFAIANTPKRFVQLYETCWHSDSNTRFTIAEVIKRTEIILDSDPMENGIFRIFYILLFVVISNSLYLLF